MRSGRLAVAGLVTLALAGAAPIAAQQRDSQDRLHREIDRAIHADGPFFLPAETALIERKCGYAPGSWNGENISINNGVLICSNGRRVDDPEVRAMMEIAGERISRRVTAVMRSPEIRSAISAVAEEATAEAMAKLSDRWRERGRNRDR